MSRKFYVLTTVIIGTIAALAWVFWLSVAPATAQTSTTNDPAQVIAAALDYLQTQQQSDGGIRGFSGEPDGPSDPDTTARAVLALAANGQQPDAWVSQEGNTLMDFLARQAITYTHDLSGSLFPARAGLLLSAVAVAGQDVHNFGGMDLSTELTASFHPATGAYSTTAVQDWSSGTASDMSQAWALLGFSLAGQPAPVTATLYLSSTQASDGSWGFGDLDTTALAVTALLASGNVLPGDSMVRDALGYFRANQLPNGGWRPTWDSDPLNADTTGWIVQALFSAGETMQSWASQEGDPLSALMSLHNPDGSIGGTYVNAYSTAEALIGLSAQPLARLRPATTFSRAGLVVQFGDGSVVTACLSYSGEPLTGVELLLNSGLAVWTVTDPNLGTAVCQIGADGCPPNDCFCGMPNYWTYWLASEGEWAYATAGADISQAVDGSLQGWRWGQGEPPLALTFEQVCAAAPADSAGLVSGTLPAFTPTPPPLEISSAITVTNDIVATSTPEASSGVVEQAEVVTPTPEAAVSASAETGSSYLVFVAIAAGLGLGLFFIARSARRR